MEKSNVFIDLKKITDRFVKILHDLYGFYFDSTEGFKLHRIDIEKKVQSGMPSLIIASGPPIDQQAIILHSASGKEIIRRNSPNGDNLNKIGSFVLVMIMEHWEHDIREKIATALGYSSKSEVKSDIMGDINKIRQDVLHNRGKVDRSFSNKILSFRKGEKIELTEGILKEVFGEIFKYLNFLFFQHTDREGYSDNSLNLEAKAVHSSMKHTLVSK